MRLRPGEPLLPHPNECREIRRGAGITLLRVAQLLDVSKMTVSNWETGRNTPTIYHALRYADVLDRIRKGQLKGRRTLYQRNP